MSAAFVGICEATGIKRHLTTPYSPQQNGVVEHRNRTVVEMARTMMRSMKILGRYWEEAVRHAVYLLNRLPTKAMGEKTPCEV